MSTDKAKDVLISGQWRPADSVSVFHPSNPQTKEPTGEVYTVSSIKDVEEAVVAAAEASEQLLEVSPSTKASFLDRYAQRIQTRRQELVDMAHTETGYPEYTRPD